jgi:single-stranded-DNA-specific exonuclease
MYAAGMTLKEENYSLFKEAFEKQVQETTDLLLPEIDAEINFADITQN